MKRSVSGLQVEIDFRPDLLERFPEFRDVVRASVYGCGRAFKAVAADLDMSVSELSRKLAENPNDPVHFPLNRLPELLSATGDLQPLYWLLARFTESDAHKQRRVLDELNRLMPHLQSLLKSIR